MFLEVGGRGGGGNLDSFVALRWRMNLVIISEECCFLPVFSFLHFTLLVRNTILIFLAVRAQIPMLKVAWTVSGMSHTSTLTVFNALHYHSVTLIDIRLLCVCYNGLHVRRLRNSYDCTYVFFFPPTHWVYCTLPSNPLPTLRSLMYTLYIYIIDALICFKINMELHILWEEWGNRVILRVGKLRGTLIYCLWS